MRRVRVKVAPNLVSAARSSKVATASVVVEKSQDATPTSPTPNVETSSNQEPSLLPNLVTNNETANTEKSDLIETPNTEQATVTPPEVLEITPSVDKENVLTGVSDEASKDNQASVPVNELGVPSLSRYKARNKIRPVISNAPHRIRTFSSASESEDDVSKRQSRTPLSPVKKSPARKDNVESTPPLPPKTTTERGKKGKKKSDEKTALEIKKAAMKRKLANGEVDRSKLTMFDLIYYNPNDGERPPNASEKLQMRLRPFEIEELAKENQANEAESTGNAILDDRLAEEEEMRMMEENPENAKNEGEQQPEEEDEEEDAMPVPQVRLGPDGEIILDEKSLVIDTSETKRNKSQLANAPIVVENSSTMVNYGSWRKRRRAGRWNVKETARFYRALQMLGTNFSLMVKLFRDRDRVDLKRKFKSEEKTNPALVDKIISKQIPFDPSQFLDEPEEDLSDAESQAESTTKEKPNKKATSKTTSKDPKGKNKGKGKALKKTVTIQELNSNEDDSDVVSVASIRSPYKKTSNEESEEDLEPPAKKGRKAKATISRATTRGRKKATGSRTRIATRGKKAQHCDSDGEQPTSPTEVETAEQPTSPTEVETAEQPTSPTEVETAEQPNSSKKAPPAAPSLKNPLDNILNSPLGQIGLEQGGLTVVEDPGTPNQAPSFLVPPALAEANPAFAQAEPGSLVLVSEPNPGDPNNQLVHVYRIAVPLEPVPL